MIDSEKYQKIQSEIELKRDEFNKINKAYLDLLRVYGKTIELTDDARTKAFRLPRNSESWKMWNNRLNVRRNIEHTKYNQEFILYDKRMEVFEAFNKAFNRQFDPSQFQRPQFQSLKQAEKIPEIIAVSSSGSGDSDSAQEIQDIPYFNQPSTSANARAIYEAQKNQRSTQKSQLPKFKQRPKTAATEGTRGNYPLFEDGPSSTSTVKPKSKLRQPNFYAQKSPKSRSEIPKQAPSFNISTSSKSSHKPAARDNVAKITKLVDQISSKFKSEPVSEITKGKCNEIFNNFFSEIQSRQLKNLDCSTILGQPMSKRKNLLLKHLKNLLKNYQDELKTELRKK